MGPEKLVAVVVLVSLTFAAGLQVNLADLTAVLRNYNLLGRALLANFVIVPILGVLLVRLFHLDTYVATGFLLMAIAPGVPFVVQAAGKKVGGSLGFAVALAFMLQALSIVTVPLTAELVLPAGAKAVLPVGRLVITLVLFQLVPLLAGMFVSDRAPTLASKITRPIMLLFAASLLVLIVLLGPGLIKAVASVYGSRGMLAMLCIVVLSLAAGWIMAGAQREYRRTLSIATALRNIGLCAVVATQAFPRTTVGPAVLTYLIIQAVVIVLVSIYFTRTTKLAAAGSA